MHCSGAPKSIVIVLPRREEKAYSCLPHIQYLLLAHSFEDINLVYCVLEYQHLRLVVAVSRNEGPDCHHLL